MSREVPVRYKTLTKEQAAAVYADVERAVHAAVTFADLIDLTVEQATVLPTPPRPGPAALTAAQVTAILQAAWRDICSPGSVLWEDIRHLDVGTLCSANQDALIDDLWEDHPDDRPHRAEMTAAIRVYDELLGTSRAVTDLPPEPAPGSHATAPSWPGTTRR